MTTYLFTNFAKSTLAVSAGVGDLTLNVTALDVTKFPQPSAGEAFRMALSDGIQDPEIVEVTDNPLSGVFTVVRAKEGTTAKAWQAGTAVVHGITAETVGEIPATSSGLTLSGALNETDGGSVASASTVNLNAVAGNSLTITGTTTITSFGTAQSGVRKIVRFAAALTLTHSSNLFLPNNGANVLTAAGDWATFVSRGSGVWHCVDYTRADGTALRVVGTLLGNTGSNDNRVLRSDGTSGDTLQQSSMTVDDSGNVSGVNHVVATGEITGTVFHSKRVTVASASTTDLSVAAGNFVSVTGTTNISGFGTVAEGTEYTLRFTGDLTIAYHATALIIPGASDLNVKAGDVIKVLSLGGGDWLVTSLLRVDGYTTSGFTSGKVLVGAGAGNLPTQSTALVPVGAGIAFAGTSAPTGWLLCYGQAVSRSTYSALFAVIGTNFGAGDGSTTFNLPDMQGRVAVGKDDMSGSAAGRVTNAVSGLNGIVLGASGGNQNMQQHNHTITDPGHTHSEETYLGSAPGAANGGAATGNAAARTTGSSTTGISLANAGSGTSQNIQPSLIWNWIIRYE